MASERRRNIYIKDKYLTRGDCYTQSDGALFLIKTILYNQVQ